jgi:hypothetical protein
VQGGGVRWRREGGSTDKADGTNAGRWGEAVDGAKQRRSLSKGQRAVRTGNPMSGTHPGWDLSKIPKIGQNMQI